MILFSRKKSGGDEQKQDTENESIQQAAREFDEILRNIEAKKSEFTEVEGKLESVAREYSTTVSELMSVRKDANEERNNVASLQRQQKIMRTKIDDLQSQIEKKAEAASKVQSAQRRLERLERDMQECKKRYETMRQKADAEEQRQKTANLKRIQSEAYHQDLLRRIDLAKAGSSNDNTKKDGAGGGDALAATGTADTDAKNVVEAASVVVASMKSKMILAQKELETVKRLLKEERMQHQKTQERLRQRDAVKPDKSAQ